MLVGRNFVARLGEKESKLCLLVGVRWQSAGGLKRGGSVWREISRPEKCVGVRALEGCWSAQTWWLAWARNQLAGDVCWRECAGRALVGRNLVARFWGEISQRDICVGGSAVNGCWLAQTWWLVWARNQSTGDVCWCERVWLGAWWLAWVRNQASPVLVGGRWQGDGRPKLRGSLGREIPSREVCIGGRRWQGARRSNSK